MKRVTTLAAILVVCLGICQCSDRAKLTKLNMQGRGEQFSVMLGDVAPIPGSDLQLAFVSLLRDSRRTSGVAEVLFRVIPRYGDSRQMSLVVEAPKGIMDEEFFYVDAFGYRLKLLNVFYGSPTGEAPRSNPPYAHFAVSWITAGDTLDGAVKITEIGWSYIKIDDYSLDTVTLDGDVLSLELSRESDNRGFFALCAMKPANYAGLSRVIPLCVLHVIPRGPGNGEAKQLLRFDIGSLHKYFKDNLDNTARVTLTLPSSMSGYTSGRSFYLGLGEKLSQQSLLPASVGNYWIYRHIYKRAWMEHMQLKSEVDTLMDSVYVTDSSFVGGHTWWSLSQGFWPVGNTFYMSGDTLFGYYGPTLLPVCDGGSTLGSTVGVWMPGPYETECGTFSNCNSYYSRTEPVYTKFDTRMAIVSPGVGILYSVRDDGCTLMSFDFGYCAKVSNEFTLLRYHVK